MSRRLAAQEGAIPFVVVGVITLGGVLGAAWAGQEWSQRLLGQAGGELTAWALRGAFWALDLVALQASTMPVNRDWYTPVLEGPALPIYALAALVMVATLIAETIAGVSTGNTPRIVQAILRSLIAGMLATAGASLLLAVGGALSDLGRLILDASGTSVDAPLVPLQEVLMDTADQRDSGTELFIAFVAALVIVFTSLAIYFTLAMRPVLLAAIIVFLPVAHALSVWAPMRRVELRAWALGLAVLLADAAILTMFAVTNTVMGQPDGVDRLIFGTFGLLLAALAPAALARVIGMPELQTAVQSLSRGSKVAAIGVGAAKGAGALLAHRVATRGGGAGSAGSISGPADGALGGSGPPGDPPDNGGAGGSAPAGGPTSSGGLPATGPPAGGANASGLGTGAVPPAGAANQPGPSRPASASVGNGTTGASPGHTASPQQPAGSDATSSSTPEASHASHPSGGAVRGSGADGWASVLTRQPLGSRADG